MSVCKNFERPGEEGGGHDKPLVKGDHNNVRQRANLALVVTPKDYGVENQEQPDAVGRDSRN